MPDEPRDAGENPFAAPGLVRLDGEKIVAADGATIGAWIDACLVGDAGAERVERAIGMAAPGRIVACWSGAPGASGKDFFPDDPAAWTPGAWAALDGALARLAPVCAERRVTLLLRPHHRQVVGDAPSVGRLLRVAAEHRWADVGVLLDPESMLSPSMRARNEADHRRRIREAIAPLAAFELV